MIRVVVACTSLVASVACSDECGDATYNLPTLNGSLDSHEECGILGTFVNDGPTVTLFPRPAHGNAFSDATFVVTVTFPGPLAAGTRFETAQIRGTAYYYPGASTMHRDEAAFREGSVSVLSVSGSNRAVLDWDLHFGDSSSATSPWYALSGHDEMNVTHE